MQQLEMTCLEQVTGGAGNCDYEMNPPSSLDVLNQNNAVLTNDMMVVQVYHMEHNWTT